MKRVMLALLSVSFLTSQLLSASGSTGGQFLKIDPSARSSAMAGASAAISDDVFAIYTNPAGLVKISGSEICATYLSYFADVKYGFLGYASKLKNKGVLAFGYTYLLVDSIDKRNAIEESLGTFNAQDTSLSFSYSQKNCAPDLIENLYLGATLKLISSSIDQTIAYTGALDVGAMYSPMQKLNTALVIANMSPGIKFKEVTDKMPLALKFAAAYDATEKTKLALQIDEYFLDNKFYASLGGQYILVKEMSVRLGYRFGYDTASLGNTVGLTAGFGFKIWNVNMDYAFVPFGELGDTHRISFSGRF
jgi:hypothetical protein